MDAYPLLARIAELLERHGLEAVLIGNAAAALQGAPVTTVDFDFLFRRTPANIRKLSAIARELQAGASARQPRPRIKSWQAKAAPAPPPMGCQSPTAGSTMALMEPWDRGSRQSGP
jgi:hypothetical protein